MDRAHISNRKHIVVIPSWYSSGRGSGGGYFRDQALALRSAGHRVAILAPDIHTRRDLRAARIDAAPAGEICVEEDGVPVFRHSRKVAMPRIPYRNPVAWSLSALALFRAYAERHGVPDLVHAHACLNAGVAAAAIKARHGVPFVVTEHSTGFAENRLRWWERDLVRRVIRRADRRIAVSPHLARLLERQFPGADWVYVPNILGEAFLSLDPKPPDIGPFTFLCAARFAPVKNHALLLDAFADAFRGDASVRLRLAGDGPLRAGAERRCAGLGIAPQVEFLGELAPAALADAMAAANAFVLASDVETFGVAVIEALAAGLPVICTASGGPDHLVGPENGLLVPVGDRTALRDALIEMRLWAGRYDRTAIRVAAIEQFGPDAFLRGFAEVIGCGDAPAPA